MSEMSGPCEDPACSNRSQKVTRVFPCLYHCQKMLCIRHLAQHDRYIERQIQSQSELEELWTRYLSIFNEQKLEEQLQKLIQKLDDFRRMKNDIDSILQIRNFHDSTANADRLRSAIRAVREAIEQSDPFDAVRPKVESMADEAETTPTTTNLAASFFSPVTTSDGSETGNSFPSMGNTNGTSPPSEQDDEALQHSDEYEEFATMMESENDETTMDSSTVRDTTNNDNSWRSVVASQVRGFCPLTYDGAFGISTEIHGVRLCPEKTHKDQRAPYLTQHFRRSHHLTAAASLLLSRAVGAGLDPMTTKLFTERQAILDVGELRSVSCPIKRPFLHHPLLRIENSPCHVSKQVRHLRDHLKRAHKLTNRAAAIIIKAVKSERSIDAIEFPQWIDIIEDDNDF